MADMRSLGHYNRLHIQIPKAFENEKPKWTAISSISLKGRDFSYKQIPLLVLNCSSEHCLCLSFVFLMQIVISGAPSQTAPWIGFFFFPIQLKSLVCKQHTAKRGEKRKATSQKNMRIQVNFDVLTSQNKAARRWHIGAKLTFATITILTVYYLFFVSPLLINK